VRSYDSMILVPYTYRTQRTTFRILYENCRATQKLFDIESWNLTGMLISMCSCAHGYFCVDIFRISRVVALESVKISNFQLVSHITKKVFDLESWNLTRMLLSMCYCAHAYFHVDILSIFRVIALEKVKIFNFQLVWHITKKVFDLQS
jgi:hypothetical protein